MYCSSCGVAVAENLSFCNLCGAKIGATNSDKIVQPRQVNPELLVTAMAGTFILGLVAIAVLLGTMKSVLGLDVGQILGFAALSFLIMLSLEAVFVLLLFRRNRSAEERGSTRTLTGGSTKELDEPHVNVLQEPLTSVTDH